MRRVAAEFALDEDTEARLASSGAGAFFRDRGEYIHVTASAPMADNDDEPGEIECLIGESWVVTAHEQPVAALDALAALTSGSGRTGELDRPSFLAGLLEWVLNEHASASSSRASLRSLQRRWFSSSGCARARSTVLCEVRERRTSASGCDVSSHRASGRRPPPEGLVSDNRALLRSRRFRRRAIPPSPNPRRSHCSTRPPPRRSGGQCRSQPSQASTAERRVVPRTRRVVPGVFARGTASPRGAMRG